MAYNWLVLYVSTKILNIKYFLKNILWGYTLNLITIDMMNTCSAHCFKVRTAYIIQFFKTKKTLSFSIFTTSRCFHASWKRRIYYIGIKAYHWVKFFDNLNFLLFDWDSAELEKFY